MGETRAHSRRRLSRKEAYWTRAECHKRDQPLFTCGDSRQVLERSEFFFLLLSFLLLFFLFVLLFSRSCCGALLFKRSQTLSDLDKTFRDDPLGPEDQNEDATRCDQLNTRCDQMLKKSRYEMGTFKKCPKCCAILRKLSGVTPWALKIKMICVKCVTRC